jgi:hypothetical protein
MTTSQESSGVLHNCLHNMYKPSPPFTLSSHVWGCNGKSVQGFCPCHSSSPGTMRSKSSAAPPAPPDIGATLSAMKRPEMRTASAAEPVVFPTNTRVFSAALVAALSADCTYPGCGCCICCLVGLLPFAASSMRLLCTERKLSCRAAGSIQLTTQHSPACNWHKGGQRVLALAACGGLAGQYHVGAQPDGTAKLELIG